MKTRVLLLLTTLVLGGSAFADSSVYYPTTGNSDSKAVIPVRVARATSLGTAKQTSARLTVKRQHNPHGGLRLVYTNR